MADHTESIVSLLQRLDTDPKLGLTGVEAGERLKRDGENRLRGGKHPNFMQKFFVQLTDTMVIILIIAAGISFVVALYEDGSFLDSVIILAIVILNACLGVVQENKAERSLDALKKISAPSAKVLRDGDVLQVPSAQVVRGDIVLLESGDFIPADLRLLESASLRCEESALTGESVPSEKDAHSSSGEDTPLGERKNMAFSGCEVNYGRAVGVAVATAMDTQMGRIAHLLNQERMEATPLQRRLSRLGRQLGLLALCVCAVIFAAGLLQGMKLLEIFMLAVSLAVAAIPEGLAAVVTVVLALGVQRMVGHGAVIRRLPAVETLGSASVICSDKTGTLTQNRMTVRRVWAAKHEPQSLEEELAAHSLHVLRMGALCSDGRVYMEDGEENHIGDPTETAIVAAALKNGLTKEALEKEYPRLGEIPFDSSRKCMTTIHQVGNKVVAVVKGGFDVILPLCHHADLQPAMQLNDEMGAQALRVLAVACRELPLLPYRPSPEYVERDLTFVGLIGMIDPPREESREAVALCKQAGIKTVMITGDHLSTASAIARDLGILEEGGKAISGIQLQQMNQEELEAEVASCSVYARVSPEDKIRIVKAWQKQGAVVAMTGDGVNDAPALKAADIGCAMGITGTDVAKGAADMVLTDDDFSTIVEAVRQGRGIYDNIKKTIQYLLGANLGEVFAVLVAMVLGWGSPLLAVHLLLVNVVTDTFPALALGVEPIDGDIMRRSPVPGEQGIFSGGLGRIIVIQGILLGVLTLTGYYIGRFVPISSYLIPSASMGTTMAFLILAFAQLVQAFNCRSRRSLFEIGFFTNKNMMKAFAASSLILLLISIVPPLEAVFGLVDLSVAHWLIIFGLCIVPLVLSELVKWFLKLRERIV